MSRDIDSPTPNANPSRFSGDEMNVARSPLSVRVPDRRAGVVLWVQKHAWRMRFEFENRGGAGC